MLKKYAPYILAVSLFILGLSLGFFISRSTGTTLPSNTDTLFPSQKETSDPSLYSSQTATIRGEITKREGDVLTVKNLNTQTTGNIKASKRVVIAKAGTKPETASPSSNLSKIELNKEVLIQLEMTGNHYEAVSLQYVLPTPSLPPIVTRTNTPAPSKQP